MFFASASVLVIEILAARLLAPYLGVSLEVFTGIIGVILAGISIGAWLGGKAADRGDPNRLPGFLLIAGGITALASPFVIDLVGPSLNSGPVSIMFGSFAGFFLPAALLSAIPPVVVKVRLASLEETGTVVGSYSAIGTAGAIFGTFVTGFVLVAAYPTRPIISTLGLLLAVSGAALSWGRSRPATLGGLLISGLLAAGLLALDGPCEHETTYHCADVVTDANRPSGRTLVLDRVRNSYVDLEDPTFLQFRYVRLIADVVGHEAADGALETLAIGGGGFTLPRYFGVTRPGSVNRVLEIDGSLVTIATEQLGLSEDELEVRIGDARTGIGAIATDSVDVVVGDAYSGASVPWHLTTVEFKDEVARVMKQDAVYTMNVIDYDERRFIKAQSRTLQQVFDHVALFAPRDYLYGRAGGNYILVAAFNPIDIDGIEARLRARGGNEIGISGSELGEFIGDAPILTDDFAPVDQMLVGTR